MLYAFVNYLVPPQREVLLAIVPDEAGCVSRIPRNLTRAGFVRLGAAVAPVAQQGVQSDDEVHPLDTCMPIAGDSFIGSFQIALLYWVYLGESRLVQL
jgi:hypothetical protein